MEREREREGTLGGGREGEGERENERGRAREEKEQGARNFPRQTCQWKTGEKAVENQVKTEKKEK